MNLQSPPTLESPIMHVTPIPVVNWNKIAKSRLPWYFKGKHCYFIELLNNSLIKYLNIFTQIKVFESYFEWILLRKKNGLKYVF